MGTINVKSKNLRETHEGAMAHPINKLQELRRSVMACLLWEKSFYESGEDIADRIARLINEIPDNEKIMGMASEARNKMHLRHVPLLIARELARKGAKIASLLEDIIQRPDELCEFLAIYWKDKRQTLAAQVKKGLAGAFRKFGEYSFAKYNRDTEVKLRDVLFLSHAKPKNKEQAEIWKRLIDGTLETPDTWETSLSAGSDKKETWERLIREEKLGDLAVIRNLRNMEQVDVDESLIKQAINNMKSGKVLPFRFIAAARYAPGFEPELEQAMMRTLASTEPLPYKIILVVDVSGSMDEPMSIKSEMDRLDAACGLAMILREVAEDIRVFTFSSDLVVVPSRHGFALRDAIVNSQRHMQTYLGRALEEIHSKNIDHDIMIVISDEQVHQSIFAPGPAIPMPQKKGYMINIASNQNGVGYGQWIHLDGFSEAIVDYVREYEKAGL